MNRSSRVDYEGSLRDGWSPNALGSLLRLREFSQQTIKVEFPLFSLSSANYLALNQENLKHYIVFFLSLDCWYFWNQQGLPGMSLISSHQLLM